MRLFLVRHGETVDNVAGIYAGTRDSPLTAHGVLQAKRLAADFTKKQLGITHIFSSDLRRAVDTALAVVDVQPKKKTVAENGGDAPEVEQQSDRLHLVQLSGLRERDFRSGEGKKFGFVQTDAETHEEMRARASEFVEEQLVPLLSLEESVVVVVVAHGLILGSLWRVLLARFGNPTGWRGESSAAWSNTGYLELVLRRVDASEEDASKREGSTPERGVFASRGEANKTLDVSGEQRRKSGAHERGASESRAASTAVASGDRKAQRSRYEMTVVGVNVLTHLEGLKKTRGGIGSAQFDKRQRTMDSFFGPPSKKARADRE